VTKTARRSASGGCVCDTSAVPWGWWAECRGQLALTGFDAASVPDAAPGAVTTLHVPDRAVDVRRLDHRRLDTQGAQIP
jgi:hypothetical protein